MVFPKSAPKRKAMYAAKTVNKRQARPLNYRTGGYVGLELKFLDTSRVKDLANTIAGATALCDPITADCLNAVALGTGESKRQGRRIWMDTLEINGSLVLASQEFINGASNTVRIIVVKDTQTNEAQMAGGDYLVNQALTQSEEFNVTTFPNLQWKDRFVTLYDKTMQMNCQAVGIIPDAGVGLVKNFHIKVNVKCPVTYDTDGEGGTIDTITDNSLHIMVWHYHPQFDMSVRYNARLRYRDI